MTKLDTYLSDLTLGNTYLHNLHWNLKGIHFKQAHEYIEDLYTEGFEYIDDVAELQKQLGETPLSSVKDYIENSTLKELDKTDFTDHEAIELALKYVEHMDKLAREVRAEADEQDNFLVTNLMEDHITDYAKHKWFLSSMLK